MQTLPRTQHYTTTLRPTQHCKLSLAIQCDHAARYIGPVAYTVLYKSTYTILQKANAILTSSNMIKPVHNTQLIKISKYNQIIHIRLYITQYSIDTDGGTDIIH
jgi:hypothetical protein